MAIDHRSIKQIEAEKNRSQKDKEAELERIVKKLDDVCLLMKPPEKTTEEKNLDKQKQEMIKAMTAAYGISVEKAEEKLTALCHSENEDLEKKKLLKKYNELTPKLSEAMAAVFGVFNLSNLEDLDYSQMIFYVLVENAVELSPSDKALFEGLIEKMGKAPDDKAVISRHFDSIDFTVSGMSKAQADALQRIYRERLNVEINCVPIFGNIPLRYAIALEVQEKIRQEKGFLGGGLCAPPGMTKEGYQITIKMDELMLHIIKDYAACRLGLTNYAGTFRAPPKAPSASSSSKPPYILRVKPLKITSSSSSEERKEEKKNTVASPPSPRLFATSSTSPPISSGASDTVRMTPPR